MLTMIQINWNEGTAYNKQKMNQFHSNFLLNFVLPHFKKWNDSQRTC